MGQHLHPVPDELKVIRLVRPSKDFSEKGRVSANQLDEMDAFKLSSKDKLSVPPHLSVWVERTTTVEQAYGFLEQNSSRKLVLRLLSMDIRKVENRLEDKIYKNLLDVLWIEIQSNLPGAAGHAGIIGLYREQDAPSFLSKNQQKLFMKSLRSQLADLASKDCFLLK